MEILSSLPGVGRIVLATLLAEASDVLLLRDYNALRALCCVAPVTKRSGKLYLVVRRHAVNPRLQQAIHHWARTAVQHDPVSKAKYTALRARGHRHTRALRSVADRLLKVTCTMLKKTNSYLTTITLNMNSLHRLSTARGAGLITRSSNLQMVGCPFRPDKDKSVYYR